MKLAVREINNRITELKKENELIKEKIKNYKKFVKYPIVLRYIKKQQKQKKKNGKIIAQLYTALIILDRPGHLPMPKYPRLIINLAKIKDTIDLLGAVHGQMKKNGLDKFTREEFTRKVWGFRQSWNGMIFVCKKWVTVIEKKEAKCIKVR